MKLIKGSAIVLITIIGYSAFGQMATIRGAGNSVVMKSSYATIDGSPFLYEEYKTGTITDVDGHKEPAVLLKYDMFEDKVIVFKDNQHLVLNAGVYPEFSMSFYDEQNNTVEHQFVHASKLSNPGAKGYYEVLYDGQYKLLTKHEVTFMNKVVSDYGTTSELRRFVAEDMLILMSPDQRMTPIKGGKSAYYDAFIGNSEKVKKIAKKNDLNVKKTEDFIMLIQILEREEIF